MTIRTINYFPKATAAKTQYCTISDTDMAWLQSEMIRYISVTGELSINRNEDVRQLLRVWWNKRTSTLPKGSSGQNTPLSFISGMLNNTMFGNQRDLSSIQMGALETVSAMMAQFLDAVKELDNTKVAVNHSIVFKIGLA